MTPFAVVSLLAMSAQRKVPDSARSWGSMVSTSRTIYAHTLPDRPKSEWETLEVHAAEVARQARSFAAAFGGGDWGELLGRWHDLGKRSAEFQRYICNGDPDAGEEESAAGRVDHSTYGARHAALTFPNPFGQLLAFCIAGHHAGLADATTGEGSLQQSTLHFRLDPAKRTIPEVTLPPDASRTPKLTFPLARPVETEMGFALAFFTRMLFSCLVDADRTATEAFCDAPQSSARNVAKPSLADLRVALDAFMERKQRGAARTIVNAIRAHVLGDCLRTAVLPAGFFSMNVPTGGGKTFASLAFALHHADKHKYLRRVIVAIPFTSIIEQTADQYRQALGDLATLGLIEHHSSLNPKHDTRANKLAGENWNAPLIVTTNVQLYESMFAAKTTPARKLHRLANSVIILDEAQTMPVDLLTSTLAALKELVTRYGCTVVLCTATQPALEYRPRDFKIGIKDVRSIVDDASKLHMQLKRVDVVRLGKLSNDSLADRLASEAQVLCIVNTKAHAADLYDAIVVRTSGSTGCYHLSTLMCAQHRRDVLHRIRGVLDDNRLAVASGSKSRPCRVISTQLVEAGVDLDFPTVYRAPAGFDSIAQAAGRCNREGNLTDGNGNRILGRVYVYDTEQLPPPGMLRSAAQTAGELNHDHPDPLFPSAVEAYFKLFYWSRSRDWDKHDVMPCFDYNRLTEKVPLLKFRSAAEAYQLIREVQTPILVPYNAEARRMIDHVIAGKPIDYAFFRASQKYTVSVRDDLLRRVADNASLVQHEAGLWAMGNVEGYSPEKGLIPGACGLSPESLTV